MDFLQTIARIVAAGAAVQSKRLGKACADLELAGIGIIVELHGLAFVGPIKLAAHAGAAVAACAQIGLAKRVVQIGLQREADLNAFAIGAGQRAGVGAGPSGCGHVGLGNIGLRCAGCGRGGGAGGQQACGGEGGKFKHGGS